MSAPLSSVRRCAVVGAGLAGLSCARTLVDHDVDVTVFDKGRGVGGRLATRRIGAHTFDLGAQYFTVRDERFQRWVRAWVEDGACAPWRGRIVAVDGSGDAARPVEAIERLVGTPDMSEIARRLAVGLSVKRGCRVDRIARVDGALRLWGSTAPGGVTLGPASTEDSAPEDLGRFDCVVVCVPADQAGALIAPVSATLAEAARSVSLAPCVAVGLVAGDDDAALRALAFDGAFVGRADHPSASLLSWVARDSSKPGRPPGERWVLHATEAWSRASRDLPPEAITEAMVGELARVFALGPLRTELAFVHRWTYARAPHPLACGALFDEGARVGLGGDWACGGRVEGAVRSGVALAERVLGRSGSSD